jgi:hypothetical protein
VARLIATADQPDSGKIFGKLFDIVNRESLFDDFPVPHCMLRLSSDRLREAHGSQLPR